MLLATRRPLLRAAVRSWHCRFLAGRRATAHAPPVHAPRTVVTAASTESAEHARIRNIGVLAHVDAGKTTTTERMLYYAGKTRALGNVDSGDTTTDFMKQERERGITIASAAITFDWEGYRLNLVDTPGHIDFTVEVERALRVLDGAVVVVDAVSGVQAQTRTVWKQCETYGVPRVAFVNKMDRVGASLDRAAASLERAFGVVPLVVHMPLGEFGVGSGGGAGGGKGGGLALVDLVTMEVIEWADGDGIEYSRRPATAATCGEALYARIAAHREKLVDDVTRCDDDFAELLLELMEEEDDASTAVATQDLVAALRRVTGAVRTHGARAQVGCIVTCGAAARNRGVQPLLDAVAAYLPAPSDGPGTVARTVGAVEQRRRGGRATKKTTQPQAPPKNQPESADGGGDDDGDGDGGELVTLPCADDGPLCALAFKVVHSPQGPLTMVRVYSGTLQAGESVYNISHALRARAEEAQLASLGGSRARRARGKGGKGGAAAKSVERAHRVLEVEAADMLEVPCVRAGNIAAIHGLQSIRSGDTLIAAAVAKAQAGRKGKQQQHHLKGTGQLTQRELVLPGFEIPPAVFALSVEAESSSEEAKLTAALAQLQLEDPSLVVEEDEDSGQTMMRGMGELHLDVAKNRLRDEFGLDVYFGPMRIAFRETVLDGAAAEEHFSADNVGAASIAVELRPVEPVAGELSPDYDTNVLPDGDDAATVHDWLRAAGGDSGGRMSAAQLQSVGSAIVDGIDDGLCNGPLHGYPVSGVEVAVVGGSVEITQASTSDAGSGADSGDTASQLACVRAAAGRAVQTALRGASLGLLEPVMAVEIDVPEARMGTVMADVSGPRRGTVESFHVLRGDDTDGGGSGGGGSDAGAGLEGAEVLATVRASVPLAELLGYSTALRTLTAGEASFASSFQSYQPLPQKAKAELEKAGALN